MSRIGKAPVVFDNTVQVSVTPANEVVVKGAKSSLKIGMKPNVSAKIDGNKVVLTPNDETKESRAMHGLYRALIQNAVTGVTKGFTKGLELQGVGYRANVAGKKLELSLGFSHPVIFDIPEGIEIKVDKQTQLTITGPSKELVGQVAAKIRSFRPPEPYLGKGVRYTGEQIRRKAGKSAGK
ncbi:50S ribosomal protein L6 [Bdellovibrio bacteriovorus]|uniref:Large ribosomal subunit protein uL6 n=1 Tax=Bdellovibrio bacteriovorus TaxID=959 RepID=A0A1Z3N5Y8_BDEBC|nr:50S ribosomal protein L6 [Bdellovibrio bacteriovorus]ASD62873.1 50S ribosomal protein L6 [Bdellovibrio bacteriovorus]